MFLGCGTTSSVIHAAGAPAGGDSARPNALVVLVNTNDLTPAATAASSRFKVPVTLVSMNCWRVWLAICGLCRVAACTTASTPRRHCATKSRSMIDPTRCVNGELLMSRPIAARPAPCRVLMSASPRWPALPVTRILMALQLVFRLFALVFCGPVRNPECCLDCGCLLGVVEFARARPPGHGDLFGAFQRELAVRRARANGRSRADRGAGADAYR